MWTSCGTVHGYRCCLKFLGVLFFMDNFATQHVVEQ